MTILALVARNRSSVDSLKQKLVMERQMTSLVDKAFLSDGPHLVRDWSNWVGCWLDLGYRVVADEGDVDAIRGITDEGQLIWMVMNPRKRFGYHSTATDPHHAIAQARDAWRMRKSIASRWTEVLQLRRNVIAGRTKLTVHIEDARDAGLCELGIRGFLRAMGQGRKVRMGGRALALLSYGEKQAAYALFAAHLRTQRETSPLRHGANMALAE